MHDLQLPKSVLSNHSNHVCLVWVSSFVLVNPSVTRTSNTAMANILCFAFHYIQVEETSGLKNGHAVQTNGLCSRKRGITEVSEEEIKKVRNDPMMPFAPPITETKEEESMVPGKVFQVHLYSCFWLLHEKSESKILEHSINKFLLLIQEKVVNLCRFLDVGAYCMMTRNLGFCWQNYMYNTFKFHLYCWKSYIIQFITFYSFCQRGKKITVDT